MLHTLIQLNYLNRFLFYYSLSTTLDNNSSGSGIQKCKNARLPKEYLDRINLEVMIIFFLVSSE